MATLKPETQTQKQRLADEAKKRMKRRRKGGPAGGKPYLTNTGGKGGPAGGKPVY